METKRLAVEVKDESKGIVRARFATLGVKDHDGDVIERGAFGAQKVRVSAYGHASWRGVPPVGVGETHEKGNEAIADLQFFMNTQAGRDHFEVVKGLNELGEWSFGFDVEDAAAPDEKQREAGVVRVLKRLKVIEVSPVLQGAGIDTATLAVKALTPSETPEVLARDREWVAALAGLAETVSGEPLDDAGQKSTEEDALKEAILREAGRFEVLKLRML